MDPSGNVDGTPAEYTPTPAKALYRTTRHLLSNTVDVDPEYTKGGFGTYVSDLRETHHDNFIQKAIEAASREAQACSGAQVYDRSARMPYTDDIQAQTANNAPPSSMSGPTDTATERKPEYPYTLRWVTPNAPSSKNPPYRAVTKKEREAATLPVRPPTRRSGPFTLLGEMGRTETDDMSGSSDAGGRLS